MKFDSFRQRSLIMGLLLSSQSLHAWLKREIAARSELSTLGSLVLAGLHFEGGRGGVGPSRLAASLGVSRSRVSQELSALGRAGFTRRSVNARNARAIEVTLTAAGARKAVDVVRTYAKLQRLIDESLEEDQAEAMNRNLLRLASALVGERGARGR